MSADAAMIINPIRRTTSERPADTLKPWEPWRKLQKLRDEETRRTRRQTRGTGNGDEADEPWPSILPAANNGSDTVSPWLHSALRTPSLYLQTYLQLAHAAVALNRTAGRHRFASRLEDHRSEVLISRGEYELAAEVLRNNVVATAAASDRRRHGRYGRRRHHQPAGGSVDPRALLAPLSTGVLPAHVGRRAGVLGNSDEELRSAAEARGADEDGGAGGKEYKERLAAAATINTRRAAAAAMHAGRPRW